MTDAERAYEAGFAPKRFYTDGKPDEAKRAAGVVWCEQKLKQTQGQQ